MADTSPHLSLPYIAPAQAQKHVTHNEALQRLDMLTQLRVQQFDATTPPAAPIEGSVYAIGLGASGDWAGQDQTLAGFTNGAWLFIPPQNGWLAAGATTGEIRIYQGSVWTPVMPDLNNLDGLGIGTTADAINRLAVSAPATLFSHEGSGHQIKLNKASATDTGSLLFQSDWSGHAEMGLAGENNFSIKVSDDGATWITALQVDAATGSVGIGTTADADYALCAVSNGPASNILVRNSGGVGGATFQLIDDLSGGDWKFKTTSSGAFKLRNQAASVDHIFLQQAHNSTEFAGPVVPQAYAVAGLPDPVVVGAGAMAYVTDETGGPVPAFSDGTNWRRMTDRAVVS